MSKIWKIGSKDDTLSYYVAALNRETAAKVVQDMVGPLKHGTIQELPETPAGYKLDGQIPCILVEDPDYEG
jgi:hypothetical protein